MKNQNYERFNGRQARLLQGLCLLFVLVVTGAFTGIARAQDRATDLTLKQPAAIESDGYEQVLLDSQSLVTPEMLVDSDGAATGNNDNQPFPEEEGQLLAMIDGTGEDVAAVDSLVAEGAQESTNPDQEAAGEASQLPYALMLALLALISLVPVSRRQ